MKELDLWLAAREYLKAEVKAARCETVSGGSFGCQVCGAARRSLFCSYSKLLSGNKSKLLKLAKATVNVATDWNAYAPHLGLPANVVDNNTDGTNLHLTEDAVTLVLFANTCDKPGGSGLCSEFVCSSLNMLLLMPQCEDILAGPVFYGSY